MPLKKLFKIFFFLLTAFSLLVIFLNSSASFTFKGTPESITKASLPVPDYTFIIMYFINNFKHFYFCYQEILKLT